MSRFKKFNLLLSGGIFFTIAISLSVIAVEFLYFVSYFFIQKGSLNNDDLTIIGIFTAYTIALGAPISLIFWLIWLGPLKNLSDKFKSETRYYFFSAFVLVLIVNLVIPLYVFFEYLERRGNILESHKYLYDAYVSMAPYSLAQLVPSIMMIFCVAFIFRSLYRHSKKISLV